MVDSGQRANREGAAHGARLNASPVGCDQETRGDSEIDPFSSGRAVRASCTRPATVSRAREPDSPSGLRPLRRPWRKWDGGFGWRRAGQRYDGVGTKNEGLFAVVWAGQTQRLSLNLIVLVSGIALFNGRADALLLRGRLVGFQIPTYHAHPFCSEPILPRSSNSSATTIRSRNLTLL
jgi:hypothetical protein